MAKKDYVLEKAVKGDLDALENILGGLLSPLFDLAIHFGDSAEFASNCVEKVLKETASTILDDALNGKTPIQFAAQLECSILSTNDAQRGAWNEFLSDLPMATLLSFLAAQSLDMNGPELDGVCGHEPGEGDRLVQESLNESKCTEEDWRDQLDSHALEAKLPVGLVDAVVSQFEEDDS